MIGTSPTTGEITAFFDEMVAAWNAGERERFLAAYRRYAPNGLRLENPVGSPPTGLEGLARMYDQYQPQVTARRLKLIVNGTRAAAVMANEHTASGSVHESIEIYVFGDDGTMTVQYFAPGAA